MGVAGNLFVDLKRKCKCSATGLAGDARLRAITHGCQKIFEFEPKRFGALGIKLFEREPAGGMRPLGSGRRRR